MEQLLKITSIPLKYEIKVNRARLDYLNPKPELTMNTKPGGFKMDSTSAKLNIDSSKARNTVQPTVSTVSKQEAAKGIQTAHEATAQYAQEGQLMLKSKIGEDAIGQILTQRMQAPTGEFQLGFLPSAPVEFNYQPGDLSMDYQMDKLTFDLKVSNKNFEFVPGDVEFSISQQPEVRIEYLGGPIYVPPSAEPGYVPLDVRA